MGKNRGRGGGINQRVKRFGHRMVERFLKINSWEREIGYYTIKEKEIKGVG